MRYSKTLLSTQKDAKEYDSINATLLQKGGFIDQTMAGVYTFLPLGLRVLTKIENIIRKEMDTLGSEILMPALSPTSVWEQTNRLQSVDVLLQVEGANDVSRERNSSIAILNPTHEEVVTPIAMKHRTSYRDLPFAVYQIQTKFRNEARPKAGLLRGREFRMKDLYSFHADLEEFRTFYDNVKESYVRIYNELGIGKDTVITVASGGDFTKDYSHEFQTICESGEDEIYIDEAAGMAYNKEVVPEDKKDSLVVKKAAEVGNIFPLHTKFSDAFSYTFTDAQGQKQPVLMGCYGIGSSRVMAVIVEKFHDDRGIIWPETVAPFTAHVIALQGNDPEIQQQANALYEALTAAGVEVFYDDREAASPGEKLADADLIGIPWRLVVSRKTEGKVEVKKRSEQDSNLLSLDEVVKNIQAK